MSLWWANILEWMKDNQIGDITGVIGFIASIFTLFSAIRAKSAAERAEQAASDTKNSIKLFETVTDFTSVLHLLDEVKRIHRTQEWVLLPERYTSIRKILIPILKREQLTNEQSDVILQAIQNLGKMEQTVEKALNVKAELKPSRFNAVILKDTDALLQVLSELKADKVGV